MPDVARGASVYMRDGNVYIASLSKTEAGFWIQTQPFVAISGDAGRQELGRRLREALDASRPRVRTPSRDEIDARKPSENSIFRLAGVRSNRTLARGARHVLVHAEAGRVTISPSKTVEKGYFEYLPARDLIAEDPSLVELGDLVREAVTKSETFGEK